MSQLTKPIPHVYLVVFKVDGFVGIPLSVHLHESIPFVDRDAKNLTILREDTLQVPPVQFIGVYVSYKESSSLEMGFEAHSVGSLSLVAKLSFVVRWASEGTMRAPRPVPRLAYPWVQQALSFGPRCTPVIATFATWRRRASSIFCHSTPNRFDLHLLYHVLAMLNFDPSHVSLMMTQR